MLEHLKPLKKCVLNMDTDHIKITYGTSLNQYFIQTDKIEAIFKFQE